MKNFKENFIAAMKKTGRFLATPFTQLPYVLKGQRWKDIEKLGEVHNLTYTYDIPLDEELERVKPRRSLELFEKVEVKNVTYIEKEGRPLVQVVAGLYVLITAEDFKPIKRFIYPMHLAFIYTFLLFALTFVVTHFLALNFNWMIYVFLLEWLLLLFTLYGLVVKRHIVGIYNVADNYTKNELWIWLRDNKYNYINLELIYATYSPKELTETNSEGNQAKA